ncbi:MAG: 3-deoxy-8-phosphooctulonate synthase [Bacteroidetes bacterium RIFOXYA12_FULL_33_9]|nr:MAG: 3-deoxy-8-phosphooctulonate synthase [Bacteroidetes bacterium RIFOXYA12_FULL_33_9]
MLSKIPNIKNINSGNFFLIAGPCIIEDRETSIFIATNLKIITEELKIPFIFKASYRKANRSKLDSYTGIGDKEALDILQEIKSTLHLPILTDIHSGAEAAEVAEVADILQIPAFLSRQTDILIAAAKTGKYVNIKKGQFLSPEAMKFASEKVSQSGNNHILLTERGTLFGYHDLIVDFRGIYTMKKCGYPVVVDITHSLQQPNQSNGITGGKPEMIETLAKAAIAVGADGIFLETHPNPKLSSSDGENMLKLDLVEPLLDKLCKIRSAINQF